MCMKGWELALSLQPLSPCLVGGCGSRPLEVTPVPPCRVSCPLWALSGSPGGLWGSAVPMRTEPGQNLHRRSLPPSPAVSLLPFSAAPAVRVSDGRPQPRNVPRLQRPRGRRGSTLRWGRRSAVGVSTHPLPDVPGSLPEPWSPGGLGRLSPGVAQHPIGLRPLSGLRFPCPLPGSTDTTLVSDTAGVYVEESANIRGPPPSPRFWGSASLPLCATSFLNSLQALRGCVPCSPLGFAHAVPSAWIRPHLWEALPDCPFQGEWEREEGLGEKGVPARGPLLHLLGWDVPRPTGCEPWPLMRGGQHPGPLGATGGAISPAGSHWWWVFAWRHPAQPLWPRPGARGCCGLRSGAATAGWREAGGGHGHGAPLWSTGRLSQRGTGLQVTQQLPRSGQKPLWEAGSFLQLEVKPNGSMKDLG